MRNEIVKVKGFLYGALKRTFDIVMSILGIVVLVPVIIITKVIYIISGDTESIIYVQPRIGKNGKSFKMYKIRTMIPNSEKMLKKILEENPTIRKEYNKYKKIDNDPRVTKNGKWLRDNCLDELPQVINVLHGDMSIIGNRPYLPMEKKDMGKSYEYIISVKPGITGYWQVNRKHKSSFKERVRMEKYYSQNKSLKMDCIILIKTIVLIRKNHFKNKRIKNIDMFFCFI